MGYNLSTAAAATGRTKSTILKSIQKGRISAQKDDFGSWSIDSAELHRVYPPVSKKQEEERQETGGNPSRIKELEARVELMGQLLKQVEGERDHLRQQNAQLTALLPAPKAAIAPDRGRLAWLRRS